jgi:hypothetical protein
MTITILILAHLLLLDDIISVFYSSKNSNLLLTCALNILLAWQVNQTWGIVYLCILSVLAIIGIAVKVINN